MWAQTPILPLSFSDLSQNYLTGSVPDQHTATQYDRKGSLILSPMHGPGLCGPIPEGLRLGSENGGMIHTIMPAGPCPGTIRPAQQARLLCTNLFRVFVRMEHGRLFVLDAMYMQSRSRSAGGWCVHCTHEVALQAAFLLSPIWFFLRHVSVQGCHSCLWTLQ